MFSASPPHKKIRPDYVYSFNNTDYPFTESESEPDEEKAVCRATIWRDKSPLLSKRLCFALRTGELADVQLMVGRDNPEEFMVHRLILALGSPVFHAMFYGELKETGPIINIPDIQPDAFRNLLRFLYTERFRDKNVETTFRTYFAADKYCVNELKKRCENNLCRKYKVSPENVWMFYGNALLLNSERIQDKCLRVFREQAESALQQPDFLDISFNTLLSLLGLDDDLDIPEEKLLRHVVRWAEHHSQVGGRDSFENTLKPLLSHIRFAALTPKEFVRVHRETRLSEVLGTQDSLVILQQLIVQERCKLPTRVR